MHIAEGVLKPEILVPCGVVAACAVGYLIYRLDFKDIAKVAVFSAIFFVASFIHIPLGPTSIHLILSGLIGAFLGVNAILAIFVGLLLQGLLFSYGGLSTLGVNVVLIAAPALLGRVFLRLADSRGRIAEGENVESYKAIIKNIYLFCIGFMPIFVSAILLSVFLMLNGEEFFSIAYLSFLANLPLMLLEGLLCLFAILFIKKTTPELLGDL
ncbi:MAG: cobalt transporter CbiM [Helicobacter sp.]|nr:cobalt transporter CbiM [Helicobacter sp.]